jgi:hypothetical protein
MIDWQRGGWTGSVNRWVYREVREHVRENVTALRARYGFGERVLRRLFQIGTFGRFVGLYTLIDLAFVLTEALSTRVPPRWLPATPAFVLPSPDIKATILTVSCYFVSTQVGLLGVISLALALVTLVSQRDGSTTDVQLYYHESQSFELVASCMALLAILCTQLLWPLQFILHKLSLGTDLQAFKLGLLTLHLAWLLLNLVAVAYFIVTTFRFVQQSARERLRERYTANVVLPREMTARLRQQLYGLANNEFGDSKDDDKDDLPLVRFGVDFGEPDAIEIKRTFTRPTTVYDVRMIWVGWVARRWVARSTKVNSSSQKVGGLPTRTPILWFTPHIDYPMHGENAWCQRRGGVALTELEKFVLRRAFRFRRAPDNG